MSDGTTLLFGLPGVRVERVERLRRRDPCGARGDRRANGGGVPVVWGGVHVGEGPGDHLAARHSLRRGPNHRAVEQDPMAVPGGLLRAGHHSPSPSRRCRRGRGPPGGCAPRSARRSATAARSVAEVAAAHGVSWPTAHRAFVAHAEAVLTEPEPGAGTRHRRDPPRKAPVGTMRARRGGGCGSTRGTPDSSTWPATRACSGSARAAPAPR